MKILSMLKEKLKFDRKERHKPASAKSFQEQQEKEAAFDFKDRGLKMVPVDQITGSVGRYHEFDSKFRRNPRTPPERLLRIKQAMRAGKYLPPVKLYQIKDEFYALDGNHRISAAKEFGYKEIEAHITEFLPSKDTLENIVYLEKSEFQEKTGLSQAIKLTEIGQYAYLLKQISEHQQHLEKEFEKPVSFNHASADWYETIYRPLVKIIKSTNLLEYFPKRTIADLYAYISYYQWEKGRIRKYGIGINQFVQKDMEGFRKKMINQKEYKYPEMLKEITAFVLVNIDTKREYRIVDKLFALKEVKEVHAVHGNVDIIVKVVLKRDLLSSDAVIIGEFVHNQVRRITGIVSTQTLLPSYSKTETNEGGEDNLLTK